MTGDLHRGRIRPRAGPDIGTATRIGNPEARIETARWLLLPPVALLLATSLAAFGGFVVQLADRGERVRLDARLASLFAREACARALFAVLAPFVRPRVSPPPPVEPPAGVTARPVPVLLVCAGSTPLAALTFLRLFLQRRGWRRVWIVRAPGDPDLAGLAAHVGRCVDALVEVGGAPRVDVVGFSVGGLAAAWYARHLAGAEKVRRLVTIGAPWRGTRTAVFWRARAAAELRPGSPLLDDLVPADVPTVSIWSPEDPDVVPAASAVPDARVESVRVEAAGHADMLLSARVYRAVERALAPAEAA